MRISSRSFVLSRAGASCDGAVDTERTVNGIIIMLQQRFQTAKRALFDRLYPTLNERQREAVYTVNGPLLILAGAGSGKTTVLVSRIAHILRYGNAYYSEKLPQDLTEAEVSELEAAAALPDMPREQIETLLDRYADDPAPAWSVLSITFTNKAANEMKERLAKRVGESAGEIWAGTFHSVSIRLLRRFGDRIGLKPGFTIYDADDTKKLIIGILRDLRMDDKMYQPRSVQNAISRAKDSLLTSDALEAQASNLREREIARIYREYQARLTEANALDFDDIIMKTVELLQADGEVLAYCQSRFRYVCVDEYQDTNHAQFVMTELISAKRRNLMVVGDDDQSIYRFRGADIHNILDFDNAIPDAKVIKLEQNYRSTKSILDVANSIIENNKGRHEKRLFTSREEGSKVFLKQVGNQSEEARFIIDKITELKNTEGRRLSDFAVLYRLNALSNSFESAFAKSGLPYRVLGGMRFFERKEIKDLVAYLCVVNNPSDSLHLMRIINEPKRKLGDTTVSAVAELAKLEGRSMFDIMMNAYQYVPLARSADRLVEFAKLIQGLREIAESEELPVLVEKTLELTGYREMLACGGKENEDKLENCEELISNAVEYMAREPEGTLSGFLEEAALVADIDNYDPSADAVVLMTVHSAKGLEFPVVFLPGLEDGIFPSSQANTDEEELEEERRLAYVAVTRAKDRLFCTYAHERLLYGKTQYNRLSRFWKDVPDGLLEIPVEKRERSSAFADRGIFRKPERTLSSEMTLKPSFSGATPRAATVRFAPGDRVRHPAFGAGVVLTAQSVGADMLYEVAFETVGTKKMMGTYARLTPDS